MESLHRNRGGASSKRAEPSEKEGMGLAVGAAMLWCKLRDSTSGAFFTKIAEEVKRCMDGDRTFSKEDMVHFVQNKLFGGIPQYAVERWIRGQYVTAVPMVPADPHGPPWSPMVPRGPPWSPGPWCLSCDQISLRVLPTTQ